MHISSIGTNASPFAIKRVASSNGSGDFDDVIASAGNSGAGMSVQPTVVSRSSAAVAPDFKSMTSAGFKAQAQGMYDRGEIDLTTLGVMQVAGNTGESDAENSGESINFTKRMKSLIAFEAQSGHKNSALSPYQIYENILSNITPEVNARQIG